MSTNSATSWTVQSRPSTNFSTRLLRTSPTPFKVVDIICQDLSTAFNVVKKQTASSEKENRLYLLSHLTVTGVESLMKSMWKGRGPKGLNYEERGRSGEGLATRLHFNRGKSITGDEYKCTTKVEKVMRVIVYPGLEARGLRRYLDRVQDCERLLIEKRDNELGRKGVVEKNVKRESYLSASNSALYKTERCVTRTVVSKPFQTFFSSDDIPLETTHPVSVKQSR